MPRWGKGAYGMLETLQLYFSYPFVRYALIVGVLIALSSSLLGVTLVLKRFSFIGDGLSHVAFGAIAVATVLGVTNEMVVVMPVTVIAAVLLLRTGRNTKVKGDAAVAMISVGALALGYLLMHLFSTSTNLSGDVCSTLFGSTAILTLSQLDVGICIAVSVVVIAVFLLFYHKIFAVTFDETFAEATGLHAGRYNLLIAVITAAVMVCWRYFGAVRVSARRSSRSSARRRGSSSRSSGRRRSARRSSRWTSRPLSSAGPWGRSCKR